MALDPVRATEVLGTAAGAFAGTIPYMAIAIVLIALLKATGAEGVVSAAFKGRESRMIILAALVGGAGQLGEAAVTNKHTRIRGSQILGADDRLRIAIDDQQAATGPEPLQQRAAVAAAAEGAIDERAVFTPFRHEQISRLPAQHCLV